MNIIELLEVYNYNRRVSIELNSPEVATIIRQIEVDKITNPMVDKDLATKLLEALINHKEELQFLLSNRILYSLFSKTDLSSTLFPKENIAVVVEMIKSFIGEFLEDDLLLFFDQNLQQNNFDEISNLMSEQRYFPEKVLSYLIEYGTARRSTAE